MYIKNIPFGFNFANFFLPVIYVSAIGFRLLAGVTKLGGCSLSGNDVDVSYLSSLGNKKHSPRRITKLHLRWQSRRIRGRGFRGCRNKLFPPLRVGHVPRRQNMPAVFVPRRAPAAATIPYTGAGIPAQHCWQNEVSRPPS